MHLFVSSTLHAAYTYTRPIQYFPALPSATSLYVTSVFAWVRICKPFRSPGIDSQPGAPVRKPYLTYWPASLHSPQIFGFVICRTYLRTVNLWLIHMYYIKIVVHISNTPVNDIWPTDWNVGSFARPFYLNVVSDTKRNIAKLQTADKRDGH